MKITETTEFELLMTTMPNFIKAKSLDAELNSKQIAVGDLTEPQARIYAEEMKQAFMEHWKRKSIKEIQE